MPRLPFPATSGRKTSLYHYCRILSEELDYRLVVAAFLETGDDFRNPPAFIDRLVVLPKSSAPTRIINIMKDSFILKRKPIQAALYWNRQAKSKVDEIIKEENPDVVIGDMVRSTEYIRDISTYRIADLDDRLSLRYQRQFDTDINGINPYGAFLNSLPSFIRTVMLFKPIKVAVLKSEIDLLRAYELEIGSICEKTIFVANGEAEQFNRELGENKAVAVPIGVDIKHFSYGKTGNSENYIGFLGAMSVSHNENSVRHFIYDIFPNILTKCPDAKLLIVGGGASEELKKLSSGNIKFTGRVEDVREFLQKCKVFVCPMTFGSGIKTKNLEAMSLGLPVVTSSIGAENINAVNGRDWIIADQDDDFANAVIELLVNEKKRVQIGKNASKYIAENFTWDLAKKCFEEILANI